MILLDSLYINTGGGKILLDYLVNECERTNLNVFYLFDNRSKDDYKNIPVNRKLFLKASLYNRHKFYKKEKDRFHTVLCFANIPPTINMRNIVVYTYFHQQLFIETTGNLSNLDKLKLTIKRLILNILKKNTDFWIVQQSIIKNGLANMYKIDNDNILILPFYSPIISDKMDYFRKKNSFLYVSSGAQHKNHQRLIEAFCQYYDKNKIGFLTLTVPFSNENLCYIIKEKKQAGYPIFNIGFINRSELFKVYNEHEFLIYPSLSESFGLGIVEAIDNGCNVIGANLPYLYEVCNPSLTFNPIDISSICQALEYAISNPLEKSTTKITNNIGAILGLMSKIVPNNQSFNTL